MQMHAWMGTLGSMTYVWYASVSRSVQRAEGWEREWPHYLRWLLLQLMHHVATLHANSVGDVPA